MAKDWEPVKPQELFAYPVQKPNKAIPQGDTGLITKFEITKDDLKKANLERVEHVTVTMNLEHTRRGDVSVELVSPQNVTSYLATGRELDTSQYGYYDWTFMSVAHW
jgi:kexin